MPRIEIFTRNIVTSELNEEMEPIFQRQYVESKPNLVPLQIDALIPLIHTEEHKEAAFGRDEQKYQKVKPKTQQL